MKRALALALAVVMVLGVSVISASAVVDTNSPTTVATGTQTLTTIQIKKIVKTTAKGVALPTESFYIQMAPATDIDGKTIGNSNVKIQPGPALNSPVVTFNFDASDDTSSGEVSKEGSFDLTSLSFTSSGVYRYYITEVVKNESGTYEAPPQQTADQLHYITYDDTKYVVDFYVDQDTKTKTCSITNMTVNYADAATQTKPTKITFTNTIACANIEISKAAFGDAAFKDDVFDFYILIPVGGDTIELKDGETLEAWLYHGEELVKDDRTGGTGKYTLTVKGAGIDADVIENGTHFQLKSGEHLEIVAPVSMIYKVEEVTKTADGYSTTAEYQESGKFLKSTTLSIEKGSNIGAATYKNDDGVEYNITWVRGTTNFEENQVVFMNARDQLPDTGINLDFVPYVVILAAAIVLGGLFIFMKKRKAAR
jgi:LPXTG-motif cell wall-anchored protein